MEKTEFKAGDIVKHKDDDNNRYKVLEVDDNGVVKAESLLSGVPYSFLPDSLEITDGLKPRKRPIVDANGSVLRLGDIVRKRGVQKYYKITEFNFQDKLVRLSTLSGKDKGMYGGGVLVKVMESDLDTDSDKSMSKSEAISYDGFCLKVGDAVKRHGDTSGSVYYITELNLVDGDWYAKLKDKDEVKSFFLRTSDLELVMDGASNLCGKDGSGKDDRADHKPRWELLPLDAIEEIVKVYTMGAEKYADDAWKTIPDAHRRYLAALFRHVAAYERGERLDKESGLSHLAHAAWNAIAILWLDLHKDDKNE